MAEGVWLEAALNGPWTRHRPPGIPVTRAEPVDVLCYPTVPNAKMVAAAARAVQQAGRPLATVPEIRRATVGRGLLPSAGGRG